jgi:hypothetical protein
LFFKDDGELASLLSRLEKEWPKHLPLFIKKLGVQKDAMEKAVNEWTLNKADSAKLAALQAKIKTVQETAESLLSLVDQTALAIYLGVKHDTTTEKDKNLKKEKDKEKEALISAYLAKASAIMHSYNLQTSDTVSSTLMTSFETSMLELVKWLPDPPTSNGKYLLLWVWKRRKEGLLGITLKAINKYVGDAKNHVDEESAGEGGIIQKLQAAKREVLVELGWDIWTDYEAKWKEIKHPKSFALF